MKSGTFWNPFYKKGFFAILPHAATWLRQANGKAPSYTFLSSQSDDEAEEADAFAAAEAEFDDHVAKNIATIA
jgi:hypothetical protein